MNSALLTTISPLCSELLAKPDSRSVDVVDCHGRADGGVAIAAHRNYPDTKDHAQIRFPTVFNRWSKAERPARSGIRVSACRTAWVENVKPKHSRVALVAIRRIEGEDPTPRKAVFPSWVDGEYPARFGVSSESCLRPVDTDIVKIHIAWKSF